jgi:hypothetical protein
MADAARPNIISLAGLKPLNPAASILPFGDDALELVAVHTVELQFSAPTFRSLTQWDLSQALKALMRPGTAPVVLEVHLSKGFASAKALFAEQPAAQALRSASHNKVINVKGVQMRAAVVDAATDATAAAAETQTLCISGIPGKWVDCGDNGSVEPSKTLLAALRQFGPLINAEVAAEAASSSDDVSDLLSSLPALNLKVWALYISSSSFATALQSLSGRVLRRRGTAALMPLTVEPDYSGYLSDTAQIEERLAARQEAAAAAEQRVQRFAAQQRAVAKVRTALLSAHLHKASVCAQFT